MDLQKLIFPEHTQLNIPNLMTSYVKCVTLKQVVCKCNLNQSEHSIKLQNNAPQPLSASSLYFTDILASRILCKGDDVKTRVELILNIKDMEFHYLPGDSIGILPENTRDEVDTLLKRLDLTGTADDCLEISLENGVSSKKKLPPYIPGCTTPRHLLSTCLDLRSIVKKTFLRALVEHTGDAKERRRLQELCCKEGCAEYNKYILDNSTCLLDILNIFPSCKPPLSILIEHLPRLMPRAYSIASSPLLHPDSVRIVFNLVSDTRGRRGLCTNWLYTKIGRQLDITEQFSELSLTNSEVNNKIPIFLRKNSKFRIPESTSSSMIMIGPGTGVAPFIGFLEHRNKQMDNTKNSNSMNILLFGCRFKDKDYIFRDEMKHFLEKNILTKLLDCFSRDEDASPEERKYVQHLFKQDKNFLVNLLLKEETYLFICGDALNMARDLQEVIIDSICDVGGTPRDEATKFLKNLECEGRFVKDVWR